MAFTFKSLLPTPELIKAEFPLSDEAVELKEKRDKEIAAVFTGESDKFLVIIGPCSADREDSVCEYMERLARVSREGGRQADPYSPGLYQQAQDHRRRL